jgi:flagellar L-ring protein FlgH
MNHRITIIALVGIVSCSLTGDTVAQSSNLLANPSPSSSILAQSIQISPPIGESDRAPHALRSASMFAVAPPEPRTFQRHDLVQIIVREQTQARSRHEVDLDKRQGMQGKIAKFPRISLPELFELQIPGTSTTNMPELDMDFRKRFTGDGDYRRQDDLASRITAEVVEVLPNGNMVLEARTHIRIDNEETLMKLTGVCRPGDVTASNTILSNQIHNLMIERVHKGELRRTNERGIIAKVLDTIFAF